MRDVDIDDVFQQFRSGGQLVVAAGPDAARRVSNKRRRARITATAAIAVVAIAAASVAFALVPRHAAPDIGSTPSPTASGMTSATAPTATPTVTVTSPRPDGDPTQIPGTAVLQQSDVPAGYQYAGNDIDGDWTLEFAAQFCAAPNNMGGAPGPTASRGAAFYNGTGPGSTGILQRVDRHSPADARTYFQRVSAMAQGCSPHTETPSTFTVTAQAFAGDESLVLTWADSTFVVVRVGELVTQIWYKETSVPDPVLLGQRAASRLCEGTNAC